MSEPAHPETPDLTAFRAEARRFIAENLPAELKDRKPLPFSRGTDPFGVYVGLGQPEKLRSRDRTDPQGGVDESPAQKQWRAALEQWRAALSMQGWLAPAWPKEYGGAGLTAQQQDVLNEEFALASASYRPDHGVTSAGPLIIAVGSDEQKQVLLPEILRGDARWCELFSEPSSGSDLASAQTRAVRDGDEFVVNGHKIWTSGAYEANRALLLARTDPEAPKHRGLSYFMVDMHAPGITVQPLVQMTGTAGSFNEVFLEDVRLPAANLIGEENRGWYYVMMHLDGVRSQAESPGGLAQEQNMAALLDLARAPGTAPLSASLRRAVADRAIEVAVLRCLHDRVTALKKQNQAPPYAGSMLKVFFSELDQRLSTTAMHVLGLRSMLYRGEERAPVGGMVPFEFLYSMSRTIAMGTSEIQRNNIATRGLGLPRG